jgi:hypothetical protein
VLRRDVSAAAPGVAVLGRRTAGAEKVRLMVAAPGVTVWGLAPWNPVDWKTPGWNATG